MQKQCKKTKKVAQMCAMSCIVQKYQKHKRNTSERHEECCIKFTKWKKMRRIYCKTMQKELQLMQTVAQNCAERKERKKDE